jgi:hypothetical protein
MPHAPHLQQAPPRRVDDQVEAEEEGGREGGREGGGEGGPVGLARPGFGGFEPANLSAAVALEEAEDLRKEGEREGGREGGEKEGKEKRKGTTFNNMEEIRIRKKPREPSCVCPRSLPPSLPFSLPHFPPLPHPFFLSSTPFCSTIRSPPPLSLSPSLPAAYASPAP